MGLKEQIENYIPYNEQEENDKEMMLQYIDTFEDVLTRENKFMHFSASSIILNKDRTKTLVVYHKIFNSWVYPGGHADGESNLLEVAKKEAWEETGLTPKLISDKIGAIQICEVGRTYKKWKICICTYTL